MADPFASPLFEKTTHSFTDHTGARALSAYDGRRPTPERPVLVPRWSFQVYITTDMQSDSLQEVALQLLEKLWSDTRDIYPLRLDFYHLAGAGHESCMSHYHREKQFRQESSNTIVPAYTKWLPNFLIVLDDPRWQEAGHGVTTLQFDPPPEFRQDPDSEDYVFRDVCIQNHVPVGHGMGEIDAAGGRLSQNRESGQWEGSLFQVLDSLKLNQWFAEWEEEYDEAIESEQDAA